MIVSNVTERTLQDALAAVNQKRKYSLIWNRPPERLSETGSRYQLTIRSTKSGISGSRTSPSGRRLPSASWHAHGYFFEEILARKPDAIIYAYGRKIYRDQKTKEFINLWVDWNAGSQFFPVMMSELSI